MMIDNIASSRFPVNMKRSMGHPSQLRRQSPFVSLEPRKGWRCGKRSAPTVEQVAATFVKLRIIAHSRVEANELDS